jgi:hypothetical protein
MIATYPTENPETLTSWRNVATELLANATGQPIHIAHLENFTEEGRRNFLLRCHIDPVPGWPTSFILKKIKAAAFDPDADHSWDTWRFFNDWVGSQFLSTLPSQFEHSPQFYGGDRHLGLILIEDVPHQARLVEPLMANDLAQAEAALLKYAVCLGHLHGETIGKAPQFWQLFETVAPNLKPTPAMLIIPMYQSMLEYLGIEPETGWLQDLAAINASVANPGDFFAYIHADTCPDNVLDTGAALRLIDFETGHFGHAFIDAAYGRMMFANCWCSSRLPHPVIQQMEQTYRAILIPHCSAAADDQIFATEFAHICGYWLLHTLRLHGHYIFEQDAEWGVSTVRQRLLAQMTAFITACEEFKRLPRLRATICRLQARLQLQWSELPDLPLFPVFQGP